MHEFGLARMVLNLDRPVVEAAEGFALWSHEKEEGKGEMYVPTVITVGGEREEKG
jgi:hypothetical protein